MLTISEYQNKSRNSRVYKTSRGEYGVVVYDADTSVEEFRSFVTIDAAEDYAEDWVTHNVAI